LRPVSPAAAAAYLTRVQRDPAPPGWQDLTRRVRRAPEGPLASALGSPLTVPWSATLATTRPRSRTCCASAAFSQVAWEEIGSTTASAYITSTYDPHTGNLTDSQTTNTADSDTTPYHDTVFSTFIVPVQGTFHCCSAVRTVTP
jgi:hypothetical protein